MQTVVPSNRISVRHFNIESIKHEEDAGRSVDALKFVALKKGPLRHIGASSPPDGVYGWANDVGSSVSFRQPCTPDSGDPISATNTYSAGNRSAESVAQVLGSRVVRMPKPCRLRVMTKGHPISRGNRSAQNPTLRKCVQSSDGGRSPPGNPSTV